MTVNRFKLNVTIAAFIALVCTLSASAEPEQVRVGAMTIVKPDAWYQASIPSDEPYTRAILASDTEASDQAIMMISVEPRDGRTLDSLTSATRAYIATRMDGVLEYERAASVDGVPAHTFVYEGRSEHQGRRKFMRTIVQKGDTFYILHGVANHVPFSNYAGTLEGMVKSVRWNN